MTHDFSFGTPQMTDEDRGYAGSRFREVVTALLANPYQAVWGAAGAPALPVYEVTFATVASPQFRQATERTVDSGADLRWGPDRKGFRRIVHPNGVCLMGRWQITADTPYSGYFARGSTALAVARYSTCCTDTCRGQTRSLSMVGKLFPTADPDHAAPLRTANFMLADGILRARYRRGKTAPTLLTPGRAEEMVIDVGATSNVFAAGHRIRVEVSSSNFPRFDRNPNTGTSFGETAELRTADQTIYHDAQHPSRIVLPVVPR